MQVLSTYVGWQGQSMEATWRTRAMLIVALMELTTFHGGRDHGAGPHLHHWQTRLLQPLTIPYPHNLGPNLVLQDDDARPHRASVITDYLRKVGVECCKDIQKVNHTLLLTSMCLKYILCQLLVTRVLKSIMRGRASSTQASHFSASCGF